MWVGARGPWGSGLKVQVLGNLGLAGRGVSELPQRMRLLDPKP